MHVSEDHSETELKGLARREPRGLMVRRLQVVILAKQGQTAPQIVSATGVSRRTVQEWVRRYNADALEGLKDRRRGLSADGPNRRLVVPHHQRGGDECILRAVRRRGRSRCARSDDLGPGRLPRRQAASCAGQRDNRAVAAVLSRAQSDRESLALPAQPSLVESGVCRLQCLAPSRVRRLANHLPRSRTHQIRLQCSIS